MYFNIIVQRLYKIHGSFRNFCTKTRGKENQIIFNSISQGKITRSWGKLQNNRASNEKRVQGLHDKEELSKIKDLGT